MQSSFSLLVNSLFFIKNNLRKISGIILIMLLPRIILDSTQLYLFYLLVKGSDISAIFTNIYFYGNPIIYFFSLFISVLGSIALLIFINNNAPLTSVGQLYKKSLNLIIPYLWIAILSALITIGGLVLLIIPGLVWAISYSLGIYILMAENIGGYRALKRSRELVQGYWWPVFFKYLFLFALFIIAALPLLFVNILFAGHWSLIISFVFNLIYSFLLIAVSTVYSFNIYLDLRRIKG